MERPAIQDEARGDSAFDPAPLPRGGVNAGVNGTGLLARGNATLLPSTRTHQWMTTESVWSIVSSPFRTT